MSETIVRIIPEFPQVKKGDSIGNLICESLEKAGIRVLESDVLNVASKVVAKAKGWVVSLDNYDPRHFAKAIAAKTGRDPRLVKAMLDESSDLLLAETGTPDRPGVIVVRHNSGVVVAGAGIDRKKYWIRW